MTGLRIELQIATDHEGLPAKAQIESWIRAAVNATPQRFTEASELEITVRLVDIDEIRDLNRTFRHSDTPTNVLSFPFEPMQDIEENFLGDLVVCAEIVEEEATAQSKSAVAHWAHMMVHGTLHLCGYNHVDNNEAELMESLEVTILGELGFQNPYVVD